MVKKKDNIVLYKHIHMHLPTLCRTDRLSRLGHAARRKTLYKSPSPPLAVKSGPISKSDGKQRDEGERPPRERRQDYA